MNDSNLEGPSQPSRPELLRALRPCASWCQPACGCLPRGGRWFSQEDGLQVRGCLAARAAEEGNETINSALPQNTVIYAPRSVVPRVRTWGTGL